MSSRKFHATVGGLAGGLSALVSLPEGQEPLHNLAEVVGGIFGGVLGSRLPDIIEPAIHSYHRDFFHSVAVGGTLTVGLVQQTVTPGARLREFAALAHQRGQQAQSAGESPLLHQLMEVVFHLAAGAVAGLPAGYVSHLACDATTPRSIPLLTRGF